MSPQILTFTVILFFYGLSITDSSAAVVAIATEEGTNVVFTFSGSFVTTGLDPVVATPTTIRAVISPELGSIGFGSVLGAESNRYRLPSAPIGSFGSGATFFADSATGSVFGLGSSSGFAELTVPQGYSSGSFISGSMSFSDETFQTLGLSPGTYQLSWPVGSQSDSFTLVVVPEPSSTFFILVSCVSLILVRKR